MNEPLCFKSREEFREWLSNNCLSSEGVWLQFGKTCELVTIKAGEALEEVEMPRFLIPLSFALIH